MATLGQYGAGTESYFSLLRFLLFLNVLASVLGLCMVLLPMWLGAPPPGPPGAASNLTCGFYDPYLRGLVSFPTQLFNLLSGEVSAWGGPCEPPPQVPGLLSPLSPFPAGLPGMVSTLLRLLPAAPKPGGLLPVLHLCCWPGLPAAHPAPVSSGEPQSCCPCSLRQSSQGPSGGCEGVAHGP